MESNNKPNTQRALVLQGGVALGAYEVGVFKRLYKKLYRSGEQLFDIVAGTSIGAINAAILVSYVKDNRTWEGSADKLEEFWREQLSSPVIENIQNMNPQWNNLCKFNPSAASEEAARRYYSVKHYFIWGNNTFTPLLPRLDYRFCDNFPFYEGFPNIPNIWIHGQNLPLRDRLENKGKDGRKFANFPITTKFEDKEPRLITVTVDVEEGNAVTFDSYTQESIDIKRVMASGSFPVYFDYEEINGHKYWDGGILSNTPLRELIQLHRDYWYKKMGLKEVPNLEVYIVDLWPTKSMRGAPIDHDGIVDRLNDLQYIDKTEYDQKTAVVVEDYVQIYNDVKEMVISSIQNQNAKKQMENKFNEVLKKEAKSKKRSGGIRTYEDLIYGRFKLDKTVIIERRDDKDSISNKWADFTPETIDKLIREGEDYENTSTVKIL